MHKFYCVRITWMRWARNMMMYHLTVHYISGVVEVLLQLKYGKPIRHYSTPKHRKITRYIENLKKVAHYWCHVVKSISYALIVLFEVFTLSCLLLHKLKVLSNFHDFVDDETGDTWAEIDADAGLPHFKKKEKPTMTNHPK
jgi:hypothetical protein